MTKVKFVDTDCALRDKNKSTATHQLTERSTNIQMKKNAKPKGGNEYDDFKQIECNFNAKKRQCVVKGKRFNMNKTDQTNVEDIDPKQNTKENKDLAGTPNKTSNCRVRLRRVPLKASESSQSEVVLDENQNDDITLIQKSSKQVSNLNMEHLDTMNEVCPSDKEVVLSSTAGIDKLNVTTVRKTFDKKVAFTSTPLNSNIFYQNPLVDDEARKNLRKLSLTKRRLESFEDNDISCFNPPRNSTICNKETMNSEINKSIDAGANRSKENLDKSNKSLTGKSELIADILDSLDDDDKQGNEVNPSHPKPNETVNQKSQNPNKTNKFFHRDNNVSTNQTNEFRVPSYRKPKDKAKTSLQRKSDVYNLSLSETSDSDSKKSKDPTADIVRELVKTGKAVLASRQKGKNIVKRCKKTNQKVKNIVDNNLKKSKFKRTDKKFVTFRVNSNKLPLHGTSTIMEVEEENSNVQAHNVSNAADVPENAPQKDDSFNNLSRPSLLNQSGLQKISHQRQLLEKARKIVMGNSHKGSSVVNEELQMTNLSPIPNRSLIRFGSSKSERIPNESLCRLPTLGESSPWRVGNESILPSVFHFSRGSDNLPSYSSSYIPSTPQKPKKYVNKFASLGRTSPMKDLDDNPIGSDTLVSEAHLSLNDSNAENQPPSSHESKNVDLIQQNENIFNSKHLPNPRRTLRNRSPLKAINIQEVLILPAWKNTVPEKEKISSEDNPTLSKKSPNKRASPIASTSDKSANSKSQSDLFGFEAYMEGENLVNSSNIHSVQDKTLKSNPFNNQTIREKLLALKKWHPNEPDLKAINANKITKNLFEKPTQKRINEIFCSTMIHSSSPNKTLTTNNDDDSGSLKLFEDLDPELTFDEKKPRRTYLKPKQKKRKVRHNFVLFMDSDLSEEEQQSDSNENLNESFKENKRKKGKGKEKEKRSKAEVKDTKELKNFVKNFNEICKEIEEYEIPVE